MLAPDAEAPTIFPFHIGSVSSAAAGLTFCLFASPLPRPFLLVLHGITSTDTQHHTSVGIRPLLLLCMHQEIHTYTYTHTFGVL